MSVLRRCKFHRCSGTLGKGHGLGFCGLDCDQTTCDGNIDSCQKPVSLRTYFFEQVKRDGTLAWEVQRKNVHFSGDPEA